MVPIPLRKLRIIFVDTKASKFRILRQKSDVYHFKSYDSLNECYGRKLGTISSWNQKQNREILVRYGTVRYGTE